MSYISIVSGTVRINGELGGNVTGRDTADVRNHLNFRDSNEPSTKGELIA